MMSLTVWLRYLQGQPPQISRAPDRRGSAVLFPDRFVQMIFGLEVALDFRRRGRALAVKRAAGREMHEHKRQRADDQQQRNRKGRRSEKKNILFLRLDFTD